MKDKNIKNSILISRKKLFQILFTIIMFLVVASSIGSFWENSSIDNNILLEMRESYIRLFNINGEANIPTWFSSSILLLCSFLLGIIALLKKMEKKPYIFHWAILSGIFLYISLDEAAILHEMAIKSLRYTFNLTGYFYYGWIIPAGIIVLIVGLTYLKFLAHLPKKTKRLFILAGCIFVGGAIGLEALGGQYDYMFDQGQITNDGFTSILETCEEFMEMTGVVIFIYALLDYMRSHLRMISFYID